MNGQWFFFAVLCFSLQIDGASFYLIKQKFFIDWKLEKLHFKNLKKYWNKTMTLNLRNNNSFQYSVKEHQFSFFIFSIEKLPIINVASCKWEHWLELEYISKYD